MKNIRFSALIISMLILISACKNKGDINTENDPYFEGIFVVNEGNAPSAVPGSITFSGLYHTKYEKDIFLSKFGQTIGVAPQHIVYKNDKMFITIQGAYGSNNGKVEVVDKVSTFEGRTTIAVAGTPNYALPISNRDIIYVTDNANPKIWIINSATNTVQGSINVSATGAKMVQVGNRVFVTHPYASEITYINATTDAVEGTIPVIEGCSAIGVDYQNRIWTYGSGPFASPTPTMFCLGTSGSMPSIEATFAVNANVEFSRLSFNSEKKLLYYLTSDGVRKLDVSTMPIVLPTSTFIAEPAGKTFYELAVYQSLNDIFVSQYDTNSANSDGSVKIYNKENATEVANISCGIFPSSIFFF